MSNFDQACERYWTAAPKAFKYKHIGQLQEIISSPTVRRLLHRTKRVFSLEQVKNGNQPATRSNQQKKEN